MLAALLTGGLDDFALVIRCLHVQFEADGVQRNNWQFWPIPLKDTWLERNRPKLPVVSLDSIRFELDVEATDNQGEVIQTAREQSREHLRAGRDFAFNATNVTRQTRKRWVDLFADYSARIEIVYLEPTMPVLLTQNQQRSRPVPAKVLLGLLEKLEPPTITECHSLVFA